MSKVVGVVSIFSSGHQLKDTHTYICFQISNSVKMDWKRCLWRPVCRHLQQQNQSEIGRGHTFLLLSLMSVLKIMKNNTLVVHIKVKFVYFLRLEFYVFVYVTLLKLPAEMSPYMCLMIPD